MLKTALGTFGQQVIYKRGLVSTTIDKAVFDKNYQAVDPSTGAIITSDNPMIGIKQTDLPDGVYMVGDEVQVDGVWYRAIQPQIDSEGGIKIILKKK
jgi:hypothetical protein